MADASEPVSIVVADDDPDDRLLIKDAFAKSGVQACVEFVEDGQELLAYLRRRGAPESGGAQGYPGLILLDLNMPRMDGRKALQAIKSDTALRRIPVVIFTTSRDEADIDASYGAGANSFISKPVKFADLLEIVQGIKQYWAEICELPTTAGDRPQGRFSVAAGGRLRRPSTPRA